MLSYAWWVFTALLRWLCNAEVTAVSIDFFFLSLEVIFSAWSPCSQWGLVSCLDRCFTIPVNSNIFTYLSDFSLWTDLPFELLDIKSVSCTAFPHDSLLLLALLGEFGFGLLWCINLTGKPESPLILLHLPSPTYFFQFSEIVLLAGLSHTLSRLREDMIRVTNPCWSWWKVNKSRDSLKKLILAL